ncbi:MAG: Bcr/CflA family drug resistance efflux transporter, partial [Cellvibrionaceae bacterium]|nr:Bcr/CflA family drug resistance efflux transporter [Cellvibrionaceae bacterium]
GEHFPLLFAALALCLGTASVVNGRIVIKYGMRYLARRAIFAIAGISIGFALLNYFLGEPSLLVYMLYLASILFCVGMVFGNMGSIAMEPLGALAGIGAAVVGSVSTLVSFVLAVVIGSFYQGSVLPLVLGFCFCAVLAFAITVVVERLESESSGS